MINETKLDCSIPDSFYKNAGYNILRLDRTDKGGGGEMVFVRKGYEILKVRAHGLRVDILSNKD